MGIRRALPSEAGQLAALWLRSRAASAPAIPPTIHTDEEIHRWFEESVLPTCDVWVVDGAGTVRALMVLHHEWVDQLYVDPGSTGTGIGGALLDHAKRQRPTGLKLWTFQSNVDARRFYEERGVRSREPRHRATTRRVRPMSATSGAQAKSRMLPLRLLLDCSCAHPPRLRPPLLVAPARLGRWCRSDFDLVVVAGDSLTSARRSPSRPRAS